ncbi:CarD family transcriptional regulator [Microvirga sp. 3-52]|uniref:CarD family transcriptional regulator n=1 Tax=Microvirga sp. 3-52 TaxID=2792425 RepID=UPI001ACA72F8|nr:CarD family transcriptional regulator [Microvirga sp. 3-52]MBO1907729.1 CarD family transcriptional regulator [Microvirga sp. 3-52]MBS7454477.1 CarD family transcriptional regulator [Microvirga sp. 3-52]
MTTKNNALSFQAGETVVYPSHGLGVITGIEEQEVAEFKLDRLVLSLDSGKVTVRIPIAKAKSSGLRKLSEPTVANQALEILSRKARSKRGMWNRRAADYQERMGSGQLTAVAEILRDLNRGPQQDEASYSERQIFKGALDFMTNEIAAVRHITEAEARKLIEQGLADAARSSEAAA